MLVRAYVPTPDDATCSPHQCMCERKSGRVCLVRVPDWSVGSSPRLYMQGRCGVWAWSLGKETAVVRHLAAHKVAQARVQSGAGRQLLLRCFEVSQHMRAPPPLQLFPLRTPLRLLRHRVRLGRQPAPTHTQIGVSAPEQEDVPICLCAPREARYTTQTHTQRDRQTEKVSHACVCVCVWGGRTADAPALRPAASAQPFPFRARPCVLPPEHARGHVSHAHVPPHPSLSLFPTALFGCCMRARTTLRRAYVPLARGRSGGLRRPVPTPSPSRPCPVGTAAALASPPHAHGGG
jgi:hypothetical protein